MKGGKFKNEDSLNDLNKEVDMAKNKKSIKNISLFVLGIFILFMGILCILGLIIKGKQIVVGGLTLNLIPFMWTFLITGVIAIISSFFSGGK